MKVLFDANAVEDLSNIYRFISADSSTAAEKVLSRIVSSIERLALFPEMGRVGQVEETREWVIPRLPYIAVYRVNESHGHVIVMAIFHGAQDRSGNN